METKLANLIQITAMYGKSYLIIITLSVFKKKAHFSQKSVTIAGNSNHNIGP
jgi:hypothetical protein